VSPLGPNGGEQHSLAGEGVGETNSDDWIKSLALCERTHCASPASECCPPSLVPEGGTHSLAGEKWRGGANSDEGTGTLVL
jgi:hypothetical protein